MKILPAFLLVLGVAAAVAAETPAPAARPESPVPATPAGKAAKKDAKGEVKKDAPKDARKDAKKKEEEMGKIEGQEIPRPGGGFLGIRIVEGVFRLTFYNAKRKPIPPDVARATLRWDAKYKLGEERTVLNPGGDANSLTSAKVIRPPLVFKLFITLLVPGGDGTETAGETYAIDFRG